MRQPVEYFDDKEPELIHIAGTLRGALKLERLLEENDVDYYVETDKYVSGFFFATEKTGAFFYVVADRAEQCRMLLGRNGFATVDEKKSKRRG